MNLNSYKYSYNYVDWQKFNIYVVINRHYVLLFLYKTVDMKLVLISVENK